MSSCWDAELSSLIVMPLPGLLWALSTPHHQPALFTLVGTIPPQRESFLVCLFLWGLARSLTVPATGRSHLNLCLPRARAHTLGAQCQIPSMWLCPHWSKILRVANPTLLALICGSCLRIFLYSQSFCYLSTAHSREFAQQKHAKKALWWHPLLPRGWHTGAGHLPWDRRHVSSLERFTNSLCP